MFNPILIMYERSGDFGLIIFLIIISLNIPTLWWSFPQKINRDEKRDGPAKWRIWRRLLEISWLLFPIIFGLLTIQIILIPGPGLWIKILSGIITIILLILLIASGWALITGRPFKGTN